MMTNGNISVGKALADATKELTKNSTIETPRLDAEVLLCCVLGCERIYLVINKEQQLKDAQYKTFCEFLARRKNNEPVSYITGTREFMSLEFEVTSGVLIPRPDTEILVEKIIEIYKDKKAKILDLCTGSGAISVSLAHYLKNADVCAVDKYDICIDTARKNAEKNGVNVKFITADILDDFDIAEDFDCIVSNPPYIESEVLATLSPDVKDYEPAYALDGGSDGLIFYRRITDFASGKLKCGGILAFEIGYNQGETVKEIIEKNGLFKDIKVIKDLAENDRVIIAEKR